ncbi:MAG: extracellular solute-binding protein, partial [Thermosynechococcaceae cyanobacterium]
PYRWGATVMAYRKSKFRDLGWTPTDWSDLWRPALKDKLSLPNQPREVIGLTLKKLNRSYNTANLNAVSDLRSELQALDRQVKFYSSTDYLQPLLLEDTWVAVGWSTDVLPLLEGEPDIAVVVPRSGTALWSDIWVWPQLGPSSTQVCRQWVEFWWQPEVAQALSRFTDAVSPVLLDHSLSSPSATLLHSRQPWFANSEFLDPLPTEALKQYQAAWQQLRA